jgi:hypothetical protein
MGRPRQGFQDTGGAEGKDIMSNTKVHSDGSGDKDPETIARGRLSDKHLADLMASGLTFETIVRGGFRTERDPKVIGDLLKRRDAKHLADCLLLPYFDLDGKPVAGYVRAKPDNPPTAKKEGAKPAKYLSPTRVPLRVYFPPGVGDAVRDPNQSLAITEGEKKSAVVAQFGIPIIGLAGVECWSKRRSKGEDGRAQGRRLILDDLAGLPWHGRIVYIVFDSDVVQKRDVQRAEAALARALTDLGAVVYLVRIPPAEGGEKLGIDDYLVRQDDRVEALRGLFAGAVNYAETVRRVEAGQYRVQEGRIVREVSNRDGTVEVALCNFTARIVEEVVRDDGSGELAIVYAIEGERGPTGLPRVRVPADQFVGMNWPAECWGARTVVYAGQGCRDHLRAAVQMLSDPTRRTIYTHLGWREIDGAWHYLHAGGAIGAAGPCPDVCCEPPGPLSRFSLPAPGSVDDVRPAVRASLRLLDGRVPDRISFPVVAAVYRAVLGSCDFAVHLAGQSGAFKSEWAALAQQHFGPGMDARHLPGSWSSTGNALEGLAFAAKDALVVVDDFAPAGTSSDVQRMNRDAERFLRAQGNNSGRLRMTSDARLRAERPPRGLTLSTGEDTPRGQSIRARLVVVELERGEIPAAALSDFQRDATGGLYARALAGFVAHLAPRYSRVRDRLAAERTELRDRFGSSAGHARTPTAVADLALGLRHLLEFAVAAGAITDAEREHLWRRGAAAFDCLTGEQADHIAAADPVDLFLRLIRSAVSSGRAHVANPVGEKPDPNAAAWGWRSRDTGTGDREREEFQPLGHRIGWLDGEQVYLEPDGVYAEVQRLAGEQGQSIPLSPRTLYRRLHERGLLARVERSGAKVRYCVRKSLEGHRREVLCFQVAALFPPESAPSAPTTEPSPGDDQGSGHTQPHECAATAPECANGAPAPARVRRTEHPQSSEAKNRTAHSAHSLNGKTAAGADADWSHWR